MKRNWRIKLGVSVVALCGIVSHLMFPNFEIDAITIGLLLIALLPWASAIIESAEFPGGWKVKFRDIAAAGDKIIGSNKDRTTDSRDEEKQVFISGDSNLALVSLRIEIEKRLRTLASRHGLDERRSLSRLVTDLQQAEVLDHQRSAGLADLIAAGNRAAHGAEVDSPVAAWASDLGPFILSSLDDLIETQDEDLINFIALRLKERPGMKSDDIVNAVADAPGSGYSLHQVRKALRTMERRGYLKPYVGGLKLSDSYAPQKK